MSKIETMEQLQAERLQLLEKAKIMESELKVEADELVQQIQPLLSVLNYLENKAKMVVPLFRTAYSFFSPKEKSSNLKKSIAIVVAESLLARIDWESLLSGMFRKKNKRDLSQE